MVCRGGLYNSIKSKPRSVTQCKYLKQLQGQGKTDFQLSKIDWIISSQEFNKIWTLKREASRWPYPMSRWCFRCSISWSTTSQIRRISSWKLSSSAMRIYNANWFSPTRITSSTFNSWSVRSRVEISSLVSVLINLRRSTWVSTILWIKVWFQEMTLLVSMVQDQEPLREVCSRNSEKNKLINLPLIWKIITKLSTAAQGKAPKSQQKSLERK